MIPLHHRRLLTVKVGLHIGFAVSPLCPLVLVWHADPCCGVTKHLCIAGRRGTQMLDAMRAPPFDGVFHSKYQRRCLFILEPPVIRL